MSKNELSFSLYANCIAVKGSSRSAIYDLHKNDIKLIPNDLYNILIKFEGKTISFIKKHFDNNTHDIIDEYFTYLKSLDLIFFTESPKSFPKISNKWNTGSVITNAILDFDHNTQYDIFDALNQLEKVGCKHLQFRYFNEISFFEIKKICDWIDKKEMSIVSLEFIFPYSKGLDVKSLGNMIVSMPRIKMIVIYNTQKNEIVSDEFNDTRIVFSNEKIFNQKSCGNINPEYFAINIKNYTESLNHNSCLNCKMSVDKVGNIKNCPSMPQSFGNIKNTTLQEALQQKGFKKYWNITKDQIDICKDCEFRYVCTDCRAYTENPKNDYSKPLKCGYDPYTNEWSEWSTNPLKQKAIAYYNL